MNSNIAVAIAIGGIIPPTIAAVIAAALPSVNAAVANTYAALLNGPPMSIAIIAPITKPSNTIFEPDKSFNPFNNKLFNHAVGGLIT